MYVFLRFMLKFIKGILHPILKDYIGGIQIIASLCFMVKKNYSEVREKKLKSFVPFSPDLKGHPRR